MSLIKDEGLTTGGGGLHIAIEPKSGLMHPDFEALIHEILGSVPQNELADLRRDFHARLKLTLSNPEQTELIEDLWDYFYDWCIFEQDVPSRFSNLTQALHDSWSNLKEYSERGVFAIATTATKYIKLKDLFTGKSYVIPKKDPNDFLGFERGDFIEARLVPTKFARNQKEYCFVRRPSYHAVDTHSYIKKKVKEYRAQKDKDLFQNWLWLLVGMCLKCRIYSQMPIAKIYDDNSRI